MDEKTMCEAVENISLIKGVIDRTSKSFTAFSKIFIYWGFLFILNSIVNQIIIANKEQAIDISIRYPVLNYIFPVGVITFLAFIIYRIISKKIPLVGLEKHLMKVWLLVLAMNVIPTKINISSTVTSVMDFSSISVQSDRLSIMLFSLSIALIVTSIFTGYRHLGYVGAIYIAISVFHAYLNISILEGSIYRVLLFLVLPFTFLYTGFFLKSRQARGN